MTVYARWVEADSRFDFAQQDNGGVPITQAQHAELIAGNSSGLEIRPGPDGFPVLVTPVVTESQLCARIDQAADAARRLVAGDPLRAVEYERSASEAHAFKQSGYPANAVPRTVAAWAINGRTPQQAADSILAEAAAYTEALYQLREARLAAKEQIRAHMAAGQLAQAEQVATQTVASIEAAVAGIGNNAS